MCARIDAYKQSHFALNFYNNLFIRILMLSLNFINPIFFCIHHPVPTFHFPIRPCLIQFTIKRSITECLIPVLLSSSRVPVINNYLNRHSTTPHAAATLRLISPGCQSSVSSFSVNFQLRWHQFPG